MKQITIIFVLIISAISTYSQYTTYDEVINRKKKGKINKYITETGNEISLYDTLYLGVPFRNENYDYIQQFAGIAFYPLPSIASGSIVIIKKMKIYSGMLTVKTTKPNGFVYGLYINNLEGALKAGELIDKDHLTSEEALKQLKLEKDKLDLGLITQEEYDLKKMELRKFIK